MIADLLQVDLISTLGLDKLPEDQRLALERQMLETLDDRLASVIFPMLSEDDVNELERLSDEGGDIKAFLEQRVPNVELIATEVVGQFKKEMLELNTAINRAREAA